MSTDADVKLADELQLEIDYFSQPGSDEASITEEQRWITKAVVAIRFLRSPGTTDEQRDVARKILRNTPPQRP